MRANERPRLRTEAAANHVGVRNLRHSTAQAPLGSSPIEPMLSMADLCHILQVSRSKLERLRAAGKVPPPDVDLRTVSKPIPRWRPETIRRWLEGGGRL
jgi:hypothetical protein